MLKHTSQGILIKVKVIPKASRSEIVGWENDELKIRLKAVPAKGEANVELVNFLAAFLKIGKSHIQLIRGETSRHKQLCIAGLSLESAQKLLMT